MPISPNIAALTLTDSSTKTILVKLQKRQNNIRWAIGSITQHRLNAFVRHANMRTLLNRGNSSDISEPNWAQHDPSERAFYEGVCRLIEKFQKEIDWEQMQNGIGDTSISSTIQGIAPLTEFVEKEDVGSLHWIS